MSDTPPPPPRQAPSLALNWITGFVIEGIGGAILASAHGSHAAYVWGWLITALGGWLLLFSAIASGVSVGMHHFQEHHQK